MRRSLRLLVGRLWKICRLMTVVRPGEEKAINQAGLFLLLGDG